MLNQRIAQNIKRLCKEKGVTISEMLKACDINRNFIYNLEKCDKSPGINTLVKIADYFGCTVNDIIY